MKNAIILHCTEGSPDMFWYPWLKGQLEKKGYTVWLPQLPHPEKPDIAEWLPFVLENGVFNDETVLVGHSAGCPLILSILEHASVKQAILVAAFFEQLSPDEKESILQDSYNWSVIKNNVQDSIYINSDNDPWGCDVAAGQNLLQHIGGTLIIPHGEGHMGSTSFNQPYKEFPLLAKLID
jgi:predicted alpha/beta hydrolase family esterase